MFQSNKKFSNLKNISQQKSNKVPTYNITQDDP